MSERRGEERNACFIRAELIVAIDAAPIQAEVHDISEHGMLLRVDDTNGIPEEFIVSIPRRHLRELVRVRRRTKEKLGVIIKRSQFKVA